MSLETFVSGRYAGTYDALDVGITRDGYELQLDSEMEDISETDAYGLSVIDGIWRGGNCFLQFTSTAYKPGSLEAFWPFGGPAEGPGVLGVLFDGTLHEDINLPIGELASNVAKSMVLTASKGTPAASSPATLTGAYALLARGAGGRLLFNSKLREVPVRLRLYPYEDGQVLKFFATS